MAAVRKFSAETIQNILKDFHSDLSGEEVGKKYGCSYAPTVQRIWYSVFTKEDMDARFRRLCALRKVGKLNPMYGKTRDKHPRYVTELISTQGYRWVHPPHWYTGATDKQRAPEHIIVACETAGITQLPEFCIVHHKDENKLNNHPCNLEIMNRGQHAATHRWLRHKKKVQRLERKARRLQEKPKRAGSRDGV